MRKYTESEIVKNVKCEGCTHRAAIRTIEALMAVHLGPKVILRNVSQKFGPKDTPDYEVSDSSCSHGGEVR